MGKFVDKLVARTMKMRIGDPMLSDTTVGATISPEQAEKTLKYVDLGKKEVRYRGDNPEIPVLEKQARTEGRCRGDNTEIHIFLGGGVKVRRCRQRLDCQRKEDSRCCISLILDNLICRQLAFTVVYVI